MQSIFKSQPPNLKQHSGFTNDSQTIFKIDYAPYLNRWFSRRILSLDSSIDKELILINLYDIETTSTYEWCRPNLQPIVESENLRIIDRLLKEDILNYLQPELKAV
jgi:hypothetical protein